MPRSKNPTILDLTLRRIEIFNEANGGGVSVCKDGHGYTLLREDIGAPVARLKPLRSTGLLEILRWGYDRWEPLDDTGGLRLPLDEALDYIAEDPMGYFWY